ncbi:putative DNA repair helicase RadD [Streptococcus infantarius subsp. infantarius]|nr:putative DNA repair helicase RadD [Streptococcus infantarius subsp. infantarius]MCO4534884.1 putative DNA repair helicase RadD [Streptococcus infantarius subsp. infantarius]MCO4537578.1 putative DNA repair helicase RadD [Streptococcus infantarius subsp. infantarius]MCO4549393.1 putative DNA repair helicase RadD [Streptococcus infantarius subsp. infantarius]MCO4551056.1 putative DNA repair helicase RadD [Streptococcus infantarius subsp. infantarius]
MTFDNLVNQINNSAETQRDRGTYFEYLVRAYFQNEPTYKNEFKNVWMLVDVPEEYGIPKTDIGVDLVAEKFTGELVAIQAKFYDHPIQKSNIDSFLSELGKDYYESGIIVASTDKWGKNAEKALADRSDVIRIGLSDLRNSRIDWDKFSFERPEEVEVKSKKQPRYYQREVIAAALEHYKTNDRGQLIMAPGTGKTFTSLKITEAMAKAAAKEQYVVLYLVPSIQLLTQTLRGWNNDTEMTMSSMAVTSDRNASRGSIRQDESNITIKASDIGYPATTSAKTIVENYEELAKLPKKELLVVFSTYQSIEVLGQAQKNGFPEFDLIIADEAHRTTGAKALGDQDSVFTKVHSNLNVKAKKRLYQTATPKLYGMDAKKKAKDNSIVISSMDDESLYGEVFYRLGFGDAISHDILTDYKLMVLAVDETVVQKDMQKSLSDPENGLNIDDVGRIIGVWNGMIKRESFADKVSGEPMKRAIAFSRTIKDSKRISGQFESVVNDYLDSEEGYSVNVRHVDGGMNALEKNEALDWLASDDIPENSARILSNVRFLTEGIDVPNLDAIIFLSPRKSQVDIVQAVGRIIRKFEGKEYGYIILPIVVPAGETPETILDNNKSYDVVWQVLNALRSVDERFEATINKLELNRKKPKNIQVIGVGGAPDDPEFNTNGDGTVIEEPFKPYQTELELEWEAVEGAIYGKIVQKVGDRRYLEDWSKDVADIARRHIQGIKIILEQNPDSKTAFERFLHSLQHNINESINQEQAIEMLAQHLITLPIFDALFGEYSFVKNNPVSSAMEKIIAELSQYGFEKEQKELQPFYESVRLRAEGIDNAQAKQKIIITLYDKFFSTGFKSTTERLGIVFTPVEVVDFIIKSVDVVLRKHFGKTLASENVHILDPFTGTGTFITRTLQYLKTLMDKGEITYNDILRKYTQELHANEIVLLSYYIAAINIEAVFDDINGEEPYAPFEGIVLTDTFESTEQEDTLDDSFFGTNDERLKRQQEKPITAIIGNPPYSIGQSSQNDNNQNISYPKLDKRLADTYVAKSNAGLTRGLYDSYVKAFRWASDRLKDKGVIGFVTNGGFLNSNSADGLRAGLYEDFNHLYIFNLRGDQRTLGEQSRKEGGKIFGSGSRTPVAISILVKDGSDSHEIHYHDIGDYLSQKEKLSIIEDFADISAIDWQEITPDANNDWLNQRDLNYQKYIPLAESDNGIFYNNVNGIITSRDSWVYGFSKEAVLKNTSRLIENYNLELKNNKKYTKDEKILNRDTTYLNWSRKLERLFKNEVNLTFDSIKLRSCMYRPFVKKYLYHDDLLNEEARLYYSKFGQKNKVIFTTGRGSVRDFSCLISDSVVDANAMAGSSQGFMRYDNEVDETQLFQSNDNMNQAFADKLGLSLDDTFAYVYGLLNSREYQEKYANDLKKDLARIPIVKNKEKYIEVGKALMDLHLNYEEVPVYKGVEIKLSDSPSYKVNKMKFAKKHDENGKSINDRSTVIYNNDITISNIPEKAYRYVVNGRSAIEWIMDQYQIKTDKKSGITDDPNDYSNDEKYIFNLLLRIINVSIQTVDLINSLPEFEVEE